MTQTQKRIPKGNGPSTEDEVAHLDIPDVTNSLAALDSAIEASKKDERVAKRKKEKEREERRRCCGLIA